MPGTIRVVTARRFQAVIAVAAKTSSAGCSAEKCSPAWSQSSVVGYATPPEHEYEAALAESARVLSE